MNDGTDQELIDTMGDMINEVVDRKLSEAAERKAVLNEDAEPITGKDPIVDGDNEVAKLGDWALARYRGDHRRVEAYTKDMASDTDVIPVSIITPEILKERDVPRLQDIVGQFQSADQQGKVPLIGSIAAAFTAENATLASTDSTLTSNPFNTTPNVKVLTKQSRELIAGSRVDVVGAIAMAQLVGLRKKIEDEMTGDSGGTDFTANFQGTAWQATAGGSAALTYTMLRDLVNNLGRQYRKASNVWWIASDGFIAAAEGLSDSNNRPLLAPDRAFAEDRLFGKPIFVNDQISDVLGAGTNETTVWFGAVDQAMTFVVNGPPALSISDEAGFDEHAVHIKTVQACDSALGLNTSAPNGAVVELNAVIV